MCYDYFLLDRDPTDILLSILPSASILAMVTSILLMAPSTLSMVPSILFMVPSSETKPIEHCREIPLGSFSAQVACMSPDEVM